MLKNYKGHSDILDDYCELLDKNLKWYEDNGKYDSLYNVKDYWTWSIVWEEIAQYNFMYDMLRERFPETLWKHDSNLYKIRSERNRKGGTRWTELTIIDKKYPDSDDYYNLFWRLDRNEDGPYIALRFI